MSHKVENMAYVGQVPWHGLGFSVKSGMSAMQMRHAAKQDYTVSKRVLAFDIKGKWHPFSKDEKQYGLVRDSDNKLLSLIGSVYKPVQTEQIFEFFHDFVKQAKMEIETAGSLSDGKIVWVLARVKQADFGLGAGKKDEMRNYLLLCSPFERGKALIMQWTSVRVVCWNTLCMALGHNLKGKGSAFRMPHTKDFAVEKETAKQVLGLMMDQSAQFKEAAEFLSKKKITEKETEQYFLDVLQPSERKERKKVPIAVPKYREALEKAPGSQLLTSKGTWWGAVNAVTFVVDHGQGKQRDSALKNAWLGNQAKLKLHALEIALDSAKKK